MASDDGEVVKEPEDLTSAKLVIATLQKQLEHAREETQRVRSEKESVERENAMLRHKLDVLCRRLFGKKSEKVDASQLKLALELLGSEAAEEPVEMDSGESLSKRERRKSRATGRKPLPKELPREVVVLDLPADERACSCGGEQQRIGEEVSEKLDYTPASLRVIETRRPKYACPKCHDGVKVAKAPPQAVEKSLAAEGLLAHVVVSKYADHLPLHRQEGILARHGVELSRSTLVGWVFDVSDAVSPIVEHIKLEILSTSYLQTDDTPVVVLKKLAGSFKGRLWTYLDPLDRQVVYDATPTHERCWPEAFLKTFRGHLQADAYKGYDALYASRRVIEVGCWAHGRRRFKEALETDARAASMLALIQELYRVEDEASSLSPEERKGLRQAKSCAVLGCIDALRSKLQAEVLPKSPLGEALRYLDNQWQALNRFVEDGRLRIDNNGAESQLRIVAVGRKNWMFAGSLEGARRAAILYSLVQSCKLVGIDPFAYFRDVLRRLPTHPHRLIDQLTPKGWATHFATAAAA
jgi:transposase